MPSVWVALGVALGVIAITFLLFRGGIIQPAEVQNKRKRRKKQRNGDKKIREQNYTSKVEEQGDEQLIKDSDMLRETVTAPTQQCEKRDQHFNHQSRTKDVEFQHVEVKGKHLKESPAQNKTKFEEKIAQLSKVQRDLRTSEVAKLYKVLEAEEAKLRRIANSWTGGQGEGGEGGGSSDTDASKTLSESVEIDSLPSKAAKDSSENSLGVHTPEEREVPLWTYGQNPALHELHELPSERNSQQQGTIHQLEMRWNPTANTYSTSSRMIKCILKYYFWLLVRNILNKVWLMSFADFVRRMIPQLAPCNALQDDVTCSATTSTFIAKTTCADFSSIVERQRVVNVDDQYKQRTDFSNQDFRIGVGLVSVMKLSEGQYRFTSSARGRLLEDFVATTNWEKISVILSILKVWEASPEVGVVENLTLWRGGIYCHALNTKEIVEGVLESPNHFSIFHLVEKRRFYVGCGDRGIDEAIPVMIFSLSLMGAVSCYYQLKDNYPKVAYASLVITIVLASIILIISLFSHLFRQSCFYWPCTLLFLENADCRLGVYILLKKIGCTGLPYCDNFEPDKLLLEDGIVEVIFLPGGTRKHREGSLGVERSPDWTTFTIMNINDLDTHDDKGAPWIIITPNVNNPNINIKFKWFKALSNIDEEIFKMKITYLNFFVKSSRVIDVSSAYNKTPPPGKPPVSTHVSFNGTATTYVWSVLSYHLFVYLMLMWGKMNHGVLERFENFMFRTYNHVFSIHGLAKHIVENSLETYFVLGADQTPQSAWTISEPEPAPKKDVNIITSCCNGFQVPCKAALGQQSLSSVRVSVY